MKINTICLCGSTRFRAKFDEANRELTKRGLSVISISFALEKDAAGNEKEPAVKELLDLVHFNKILRADAVVIVSDASSYIGFSTSREILWAEMQGKVIIGMPGHDWRMVADGLHNWGVCDESDYWVKRAKQRLLAHASESEEHSAQEAG